jgi:parallel beta-helix repeat protein
MSAQTKTREAATEVFGHKTIAYDAADCAQSSYAASGSIADRISPVAVRAGHPAPDDTVAILFSDIEDSTVLTERLGDQRWLEVLRSHNQIFRKEISRHGGYEVKSQGDGFMLVFGDPCEALACAVSVQRAFAERGLDKANVTPRVRMGLHMGEVIAEEGDFFGKNVILAARITAKARGGEILVSEELREAATNGNGSGLRFHQGRALKLKGLSGHHRVFHADWGSSESGASAGPREMSTPHRRLNINAPPARRRRKLMPQPVRALLASAALRPHVAPPILGSLVLIVALSGAGTVALGGGRAMASAVRCGDTITADTRLESDLTDCPNNGIVIGADHVTLDLNGHLIDGDGRPFSACPKKRFCDFGVVDVGHTGVTVMHGSVREFDVGAVVGNTRHSRVVGISSSGNRFGALSLFDSEDSLVQDSSGDGSTARHGGGIFLSSSHRIRILHDSFRRNRESGIHVTGSTHNLIEGNRLSDNKQFGIVLGHAERNRVRANRIVRDGLIGINVAPGNRNVIARNFVSHLRRTRGRERSVAIEVDGGNRNLIARNSVLDTPGSAIVLGYDVIRGNVVRANRIRRAGADGVQIEETARRTRVTDNLVIASGGDGFDIKNPTTTLAENRAWWNGRLGIDAVAGVIDGGGNLAGHSGDPRQCTQISCR